MQDIHTIYEDKYLKITEKDLTLFWYYFPLGQNKIIKLSEIKEMKLGELSLLHGKYRLWGMDVNCNWYPLDALRFKKSHCISLDIGSKIKPNFTSDKIEIIYNILKEKVYSKK